MNIVYLSKPLLIFYLLISTNYIKDLYSGQLQDYLKENRFAQHIVGFIAMLVIINIFGEINEPNKLILYSVLAYLWFVLSSKLDLQWNLAIILLLLLGYIYQSNLLNYETNSQSDETLTEEDIERIKNKNNKIKNIIFYSILIVTLIGSGLYFYKKINQYGPEFDINKFLFNNRNK